MPNATIKVNPPGIFKKLMNSNSNEIDLDSLMPLLSVELEHSQWVYIKSTPTAINASVDPIADAQVGAGAQVERNLNGFTMAYGHMVLLAARKRAGASANIVDNHVMLRLAGKEICRIDVSAAEQTAGLAFFRSTGDLGPGGDDRVIIAAAESNVTGGAITASTNVYSKTGHGFKTGDRLKLVSLTGGTGLTATSQYYFYRIDADTGYLCNSPILAEAGTAIDVTLDASSVVLARQRDIGLHLSQAADPNLEVHVLIVGEDSVS